MIDFIYKLNEVLPNWPNGAKWSLTQISDATGTSMPHVIQYLSEGLGKEMDIAGSITVEEANEALELLRRRLKPEIEQRERQLAERRQRALDAYDRTFEQIRVIQTAGRWHQAFRSLSYFTGEYEADLPRELVIQLCSETLRAGIKSKANIQELGQWLQKGVALAMRQNDREGIEDALDFVDAYGDYFLSEDSGKGPLLLGSVLAALEEPAARCELWEQFKGLIGQFYPAA